ncbi:DUF6612 family protein [[Clostridium] symbiosum]|uniref:DUF6612 family protein n=1 Tax=Clostridium symbiosum TaxID=1512 RepID=UPI0032C02543
MKRLMTALLAAVMTVTMAGTALAAEDPAALLERVTQKANELDSMDCDLGVHAVMVMQDPEMDLDLSLNLDMMMNMKMDQIKSGNLRYKADMAMEFLGQTEYATVFYKDGYYYMDSNGEKIKYPMDLNSMIASVEQTTAAADLAPSLMKSLSVREEGENRVLSYVADPAKMNAYVQDALKPLLGSMDVGMIIREVKGEYVINKDDYYTSMNMYMVMDMSSYGETLRIIMLLEGNFNNPGQPVNLELPSTDGYSDLSTYYGTLRGSSGATGPAAEIW